MVIGKEKIIYERKRDQTSFKVNQNYGRKMIVIKDVALLKKIEIEENKFIPRVPLSDFPIDLMHNISNGKLVFKEMNLNPGWRNLYKNTKINLPLMIAEFLPAEAIK